MRRVFLSPLFQFEIPWMDRHVENFNQLRPHWRHVIFTDQAFHASGNVRRVSMTVEQFVGLADLKLGMMPAVTAPGRKFGDLRPAFGRIFEDYIRGAEYWGHMDFDVVLGDLDYFSRDLFSHVDIFSTDPEAINGVFTLYRNVPSVNRLFSLCPDWERIFASPDYHAFDEGAFSRFVVGQWKRGTLSFVTRPELQEYDRQHPGGPHLEMVNGRLYSRQSGREIMLYHFKDTKPRWPL